MLKNLFFNVPARRNFLKSNTSELRNIVDEFTRIALAHPSISFRYFSNGTEQYNLASGSLKARIIGLFGNNCVIYLCDKSKNICTMFSLVFS